MADDIHAIRGVHLLGGLRALDDGSPDILVGVNGQPPVITLPRPPYATLYHDLQKTGLRPVGVEFVSHPIELNGEAPIEWQVWDTVPGFKLMDARHNWSNIKVAKSRQGDTKVADIAARISTYFVLLNLRIQQLSNAYHETLRSQVLSCRQNQPSGGLFSNMFMREIEAALHAFFADASAFRDILSEACWILVLSEDDSNVLTMATFLKRTRNSSVEIVREMHAAADSGGWIKNLTDIRNDIAHVAPLSQSHEHAFCDIRVIKLTGATKAPTLHFPLTQADGSMRKPTDRRVDYSDDDAIKRSFEEYRLFVANSGDALEYAWRTVSNLVALAEKIRAAAGLEAPVPHIEPIGPVRIID